MPTPHSIGERLRAERLRLGMTQPQFAAAAGVSKTSQVNYEQGDRSPDAEYLLLVSRVGVDVTFVVTGQRASPEPDPEVIAVPRYQLRASAGSGAVNEQAGEYQVNALCVTRAWVRRRRLSIPALRAVAVRGTSMQPVLSDGDLVVVDTSDTDPRSGFVYLLRRGEELLVKYVERLSAGSLRVSSANPAFAPYEIDLQKNADVAILGRVVASMHDW